MTRELPGREGFDRGIREKKAWNWGCRDRKTLPQENTKEHKGKKVGYPGLQMVTTWDLRDGVKSDGRVFGRVWAGMGVLPAGMVGFWAGLFCWSDNVCAGFRVLKILEHEVDRGSRGWRE